MKTHKSQGKKKRSDKNRDGKPVKKKRSTTLFEDINNIIRNQELQQKSKTINKKKRVATSIGIGDDNDKKSKQGRLEVVTNQNKHSESSSEEQSSDSNASNDEDAEGDVESENENKDIEEDVANSESENSDSESISTKQNKNSKSNGKNSIVTPHMKSLLQWYVRNPLFKRVKVLDESHLDAKGTIMQEALDKLKIDRTSRNVNAYINEFRQIIKRSISSRRGYVKRKIGQKFICKFLMDDRVIFIESSIFTYYHS